MDPSFYLLLASSVNIIEMGLENQSYCFKLMA